MKNRLACVLCLVFAWLPSLCAKEVTLFILAGQSNAQGWKGDASRYPADPNGDDARIPFHGNPRAKAVKSGWATMGRQEGRFPAGFFGPEVTFSRKVLESGGHPAVFKFCRGSTSLANNWKGPGENGLYDAMVAELKNAVAQLQHDGDQVSYGAFIWIQGESDAQTKEMALAYEGRLARLIQDIRTRVVGQATLPVILGLDEQHSLVKANPEVIAAQEHLAAGLPACIRTSMLGLKKADGTHLTPEGLMEHGGRLFEAYQKLKARAIAAGASTQTIAGAPVAASPKPPQSPVEPVTQPGNGYDWMARHIEAVALKTSLNPDLVFIGDSITHHWGGLPEGKLKRGEKVLKSAFANHRVLNLGFGSDRTQHAIWRLDHGELAGSNPKWVVINIGSNNTSDHNTAEEIMAGIQAVCERVKTQTPHAKIILMSIFPRDEKPDRPRRKMIVQINRMIAGYAKANGITNLDIGDKYLDANGCVQRSLLTDFCHPNEAGYKIWADALLPYLEAR